MTDTPETMRAVRADGAGGAEVLRVVETAVPHPAAGEVLIGVAAAGVNRPDILQRRGAYPPPPGASDILGLEVAGEIVACGAGVTDFAVGDKVCALVASGGYAEYCAALAPQCLPVPRGLSLTEAGGLPETFFTVWTNVFDRGRLRAGESILVHGGSSGIGLTALQLARAFGARVFVTVGDRRKAEFCTGLGAELAIDHTAEDFVAAVREATGGRGVDLVLDMVGGSYTPRNLKVLADEGRLVQIAYLESSRIEADFAALMVRRLTWTGSTLRPRTVEEKHAIARALAEHVWPLLEAGTVKVVVDSTFPLDDVARAHELMESRRHIGKIVLLPSPD